MARSGTAGAAAGLLIALSLLAGCTDNAGPSPDIDNSPSSTSPSAPHEPFGEPCAGVPAGYEQTVDAPVAAAIAAEPLLSNLDVLLQQADLVDALDTAAALTVLAPIDPAFQVLPPDTYEANLRPPRLQPLLDHHVVETRLTINQLVPGQTTRNGDGVTFFPDGQTVSVPADNTLLRQVPATVCGTLETTNATVYLIDQVLAPRE